MTFSKIILLWYSENKRSLPWRNTTDPYRIWLSEIMLQQTRVAQGTPYYIKFIEEFPTVYDLADASEEKVLKLWQGLGYYSRARNLHFTAKKIVEEHDGNFPDTYKELLKLKGVGDYTASAIASISYNLPEAVVDGNVYRVLSRYFGVDIPINSSEGITFFKNLARKVLSSENIREYNQGIMEFGAIQCAPKRPLCLSCPLTETCVALQTNSIYKYPVKLKKAKVKKRFFNYLVVLDEERNTHLIKRSGKDIWQNLYEFPLLETREEISVKEIKQRLPEILTLEEPHLVYESSDKTIVHKLSHQHLHTKFWIVKTSDRLVDGLSPMELDKYPVPVLIADFIKTLKNSYF
ncbi:MAG: A/G-specific adenine glycosylase [Eudoraea sp.]|uniref:A/G-specific adenine glycosylase n=1 Tax=Eudoraea sp. TaxID=1979955 RepID=UPI003C7359CA